MQTEVKKAQEVQVISKPQQALNFTEVMSISKAFAESGMFPDIKSAAQAMVKVVAGQEVGIKPFAAMTGIHMIQGKPVIGAHIIAGRIKAHPKYEFKIVQHTEKVCSLDFFEGKKKVGNSSFTIDEAKAAGTGNLNKFPKNMLFARAITNGQKWYAPDVFDVTVYSEGDEDILRNMDNDMPEDTGEPAVLTEDIRAQVAEAASQALVIIWNDNKPLQKNKEFMEILAARREQLKKDATQSPENAN